MVLVFKRPVRAVPAATTVKSTDGAIYETNTSTTFPRSMKHVLRTAGTAGDGGRRNACRTAGELQAARDTGAQECLRSCNLQDATGRGPQELELHGQPIRPNQSHPPPLMPKISFYPKP